MEQVGDVAPGSGRVLPWPLVSRPGRPSVVAAGTFSISGFIFITPASGTTAGLAVAFGGPVHSPVTGEGGSEAWGAVWCDQV